MLAAKMIRGRTEAWMRVNMARAFDLRGGPLFRYAPFKTAFDRFFWYKVNHHLINDVGASLVERRVAELSRGLLDGQAPSTELPPSLLDHDSPNRLVERKSRALKDATVEHCVAKPFERCC
jgi:hypothetical protein